MLIIDCLLFINNVFKGEFAIIFCKAVSYVDFQSLLDPSATFSPLRDETVIDLQYFVSSIKVMKNIHFLLIDQISYIFATE